MRVCKGKIRRGLLNNWQSYTSAIVRTQLRNGRNEQEHEADKKRCMQLPRLAGSSDLKVGKRMRLLMQVDRKCYRKYQSCTSS